MASSSTPERWIAALRKGALDRSGDDPVATLFRALYDLPTRTQVELAAYMTARYLPIFERRHPDVTWPRALVSDVGGYFGAHGPGLPDDVDDRFDGEAEFYYCLCGLSDAWRAMSAQDAEAVTRACATVVVWAIGARAENVRRADDPEGVRAWERGDEAALLGASTRANVAVEAVRAREWRVVADWLEDHDIAREHEVSESAAADRERALARWLDDECLL